MITYEVLPLAYNGKVWWFACELKDFPLEVVCIGCGCERKEDAETILKYFLED